MLIRRIALPAVALFLSSPAAMADPPAEPWPITAVVVFTQEAISDMAALPEPGDIKTPGEWISTNIVRANDGLEARNLDEYAEFVAVNEENQVLVLDDENGDPYSEANVGYGTMNSDIENNLGTGEFKVNGQNLGSLLSTMEGDTLVIVASNGIFSPAPQNGSATVNVKNPLTGAMSTKRVVIVDVFASADASHERAETSVWHEWLHNLGVFDNSGQKTAGSCTAEMQTSMCPNDREFKPEVHNGNYEEWFCSAAGTLPAAEFPGVLT